MMYNNRNGLPTSEANAITQTSDGFIWIGSYAGLIRYDGNTFERVGKLDCGMFYIEYPARPIKAVRITCTSRGNGAEWVSIQPPTIWPKL